MGIKSTCKIVFETGDGKEKGNVNSKNLCVVINSMNMRVFICFCIIAALYFLSVLPATIAQDVNFVPSITFKEEYNDNVAFTAIDERDDFIATIGPALKLDYATELLDLQSNIALDILRYIDETDLNTENQHYDLNIDYKLTQRYTLFGTFSYIKDTTLESELEETGLLNVRAERERNKAEVGFSRLLSELSDIEVNYAYTGTDYGWAKNVDYDSQAITFFYNRKLNRRLDVLTVQPYFLRIDSEVNEVDNFGLSLGWSHPFSETSDLTTLLGVRYTEIVEGNEKDSDWGGVLDVKLQTTGQASSAAIGYSHNIGYSALGEPIERDVIYCSAKRMLTARLGTRFLGRLYLIKSQGQYEGEDGRYFMVSPLLFYKITKKNYLEFGYSYSNSYDNTRLNNREYDRNRIWVSIHFRFPEKW